MFSILGYFLNLELFVTNIHCGKYFFHECPNSKLSTNLKAVLNTGEKFLGCLHALKLRIFKIFLWLGS